MNLCKPSTHDSGTNVIVHVVITEQHDELLHASPSCVRHSVMDERNNTHNRETRSLFTNIITDFVVTSEHCRQQRSINLHNEAEKLIKYNNKI